MQRLLKHKKKIEVITLIVIFVIFIFLLSFLDIDQIGEIIKNWGFWGQLVYVLFLILSVIISPLISIPLWLTAYAAYGFWWAAILTYIGNLIGGMCAFFIARKYGRPIIKKFAGSKSLEKIDKFTDVVGWKTFFVLRLLTNNYFDYVSYAAGVSNMNSRLYFVITAITSFIWSIFVFFIIQGTYNITKIYTLVVLVVLFLVLIPVFNKLLSIFEIQRKSR